MCDDGRRIGFQARSIVQAAAASALERDGRGIGRRIGLNGLAAVVRENASAVGAAVAAAGDIDGSRRTGESNSLAVAIGRDDGPAAVARAHAAAAAGTALKVDFPAEVDGNRL